MAGTGVKGDGIINSDEAPRRGGASLAAPTATRGVERRGRMRPATDLGWVNRHGSFSFRFQLRSAVAG
jgi:hypothetical protein